MCQEFSLAVEGSRGGVVTNQGGGVSDCAVLWVKGLMGISGDGGAADGGRVDSLLRTRSRVGQSRSDQIYCRVETEHLK